MVDESFDAGPPDATLLTHAVELAPDGVLIVSRTGQIVYANRSMHQMSGHTRLVGSSVHELVPDRSRDAHVRLQADYVEHPTQRPMGAGLSLTLLRADGGETPVEISLSPLAASSQEDGFVIAAVRDISERLENQQRLAVANEQLALVAERERIGRDLHDVVLQHLYGMGLSVQATGVGADPTTSAKLEAIVDDIDRIISEVRTIVFTLGTAGHRGALGQELADVMAQASRVLGFTPALRLDGPVESVLTDDVRTEMVASMREALGNVARHAEATSTEVQVALAGDRVVMTVSDNGQGPPADDASIRAGHGLVNLQHRAAAFGGECELRARPDTRGAVLRWSVPF